MKNTQPQLSLRRSAPGDELELGPPAWRVSPSPETGSPARGIACRESRPWEKRAPISTR